MNKAFFKWYSFTFPITLSLIHMVCSSVGSYFVMRASGIRMQSLSGAENIPIVLFSVLFTANIVVGNSALRWVNVSLVQVVRSLIPGITMVLSTRLLGKSYTRQYYYIIGLVCFGVTIASLGEVEFNALGFSLTLLVCFLSSLKSVMTNKFLVGKLQFHPFELLFRMSSLASIQMAIVGWWLESEDVGEWWSVVSDEEGSIDPQAFGLALAANGAMAFLLNYSNFMTTKKTSALTVTVAGNVKHILTIVLSIVVFQNPISFMNGLGTVITLVGAILYSGYDYARKNWK
jgi:drug/metabolite transporter (DMT)-like permease